MSTIAFNVPETLAFDTYQQLIEALNDWLDRSDLSGSAPAMIALCEARLRRELAPLVFETTQGVTVTDGVGAFTTGFDKIRAVFANGEPLDEVAPDIGRQFAAGEYPQGYSLEANQIRIWPAWTGAINVLYQGRLPALSEANPSNDVLLQHPDVYFFGSMMFAEGYLANDDRAALFRALWVEAIEGLKQFYKDQRRNRPRLRNPAVVV